MKFKCYDTCSLLLYADNLFSGDEDGILVIPSIVLEELENIKTSYNKDPEVKASARRVLQKLNKHFEDFKIQMFEEPMLNEFVEHEFTPSNDLRIIASVLDFKKENPEDEVIFITNDLLCKHIASMFLDKVEELDEEIEDYEGYKEVYLDNDNMANFYSTMNENVFDLLVNEY